jgi:hypothetical protein
MGLQSLEDVLGVTAPTHVVMLQSVSARKNLPHCAFWLDPAAHWQPPPQLLYIPGINSQEADPGNVPITLSGLTNAQHLPLQFSPSADLVARR